MMIRRLATALCVAMALAWAGSSVATVSTSGTLTINGTQMPSTAGPSWPLVQGDEIATGNQSAVITFPDGSRITIGKNSRIKLGTAAADLQEGSAQYKLGKSSNLKVTALGRPTGNASGSISVASNSTDKNGNADTQKNNNSNNSKNKPDPRSPHSNDDE